MGAGEGWRAASEGLLHKVRMSGPREMDGAEKPGVMAANFANPEKTTQVGVCTKIRAMGEMGHLCREPET